MNKGANQISREEIRKEKCKRSREKKYPSCKNNSKLHEEWKFKRI